MPILCIGTSHRVAPLEVRERLAYTPEAVDRFLAEAVTSDVMRSAVEELAVVSTCNRTELYAVPVDPAATDAAFTTLTTLLAKTHDLPPDRFAPHLYRHVGLDAVRHLCRVTGGLDSMVIGEAEILGQVAAAHEAAQRHGASGPILDATFRTAITAGRRARGETRIGHHPASVSSEAVRLAAEACGGLEGRRVLLIGTGKMGRLAGEALRSRKPAEIVVVGRTSTTAGELAVTLGARAAPWHGLAEALAVADVVICSTSAPHEVVTAELVRTVRHGNTGTLVIIDIAVPRDVEPGVGALPGVRLFDIDALKTRVEGNLAERRDEIPRVEAIITEEVDAFDAWHRSSSVRPLVAELRAWSEGVRRRELQRALQRLGDVTPETREQIDHLTRALVNKLLHEPTRRLRGAQEATPGVSPAEMVRDLFGLTGSTRTGETDRVNT